MDCKDLIKLFRHTVEHGNEEPQEYCTNRCGGCKLCDQAADAIEALLAERDAAVNELKYRVGCKSCAYFCVSIFEEPCYSCRKEKKFDKWKWRGPQKHD